MTQPLSGYRIISIIGQQGSGKTAVGRLLALTLGAQHIEASDVVTELTGVSSRDDMPTTNARTKSDPTWLARGIHDRIILSTVIITGVREVEVHNYFNSIADLQVIALWAPENERYARVKNEGKVVDFPSFKQHGANEMKIGLAALLDGKHPTYISSWFSISDVAAFIHSDIVKGSLIGQEL